MYRAHQASAATASSSPRKFRKMTWLESGMNYATAAQQLSPSKAMVLFNTKPRGVKPFRSEKHSRFSSVGSHILTVKSFVDKCGLSHEEEKQAREMPDKKAISTKPEVRLGAGVRFQGPDTHFVSTSAAMVDSCGLSHDEERRARELPERKGTSAKSEVNLGGLEHRFEGPNTHFVKAQGADTLLGQPQVQPVAASLTIPKNNWLKNLWAVAGTAMEDREMLQCDAVMAPTMVGHADLLQAAGTVVAKMAAQSGPRFTYQKPTAAASLGGYTSHEMTWHTRGAALMKIEKHSRFSTFGSHHYKKV